MSSLGSHDYQAARQIEITATGNIDDLDPQGSGLIIMNNATLATIRGIKAGYNGKVITIISNGAGQVNLTHNDSNSLAPNRLLNFVISSYTSLAAGKGIATYQYIGNKWKLINHNQGAFINVPYDAANFTASAGTWGVDAGDQSTYSYTINGNILILQWTINATDVSASASLRIAIPAGFLSALSKQQNGVYRAINAGAIGVPALCRASSNSGYLELFADMDGNNFTITSGDNTFVQGTAPIEVQ